MRKAFFGIDGLEGGIYAGYTKGDKWNGWDCPYFPTAPANQIMFDLEGQSDYDLATFDAPTDSFVTRYEGGEEENEYWEGMDIEVDGETVHVYPIGSHGWVWQEIKNVKEYEWDEYFQARVLLSYVVNNSGHVLEVELWQFHDKENDYRNSLWTVQVDNKDGRIKNHDDLLAELKKEYYYTEGCSVTL